MNLVNYLQFLEPVQEHVTRIYSTASEIIIVIIALWCLNFIAGLIHRTYSTGKSFGGFYRMHLHKYLKSLVRRLKTLIWRNAASPNGA